MTNYNESKMLEREILVLTLKMHTKRIKLKKLLKRERERERQRERETPVTGCTQTHTGAQSQLVTFKAIPATHYKI